MYVFVFQVEEKTVLFRRNLAILVYLFFFYYSKWIIKEIDVEQY